MVKSGLVKKELTNGVFLIYDQDKQELIIFFQPHGKVTGGVNYQLKNITLEKFESLVAILEKKDNINSHEVEKDISKFLFQSQYFKNLSKDIQDAIDPDTVLFKSDKAISLWVSNQIKKGAKAINQGSKDNSGKLISNILGFIKNL